MSETLIRINEELAQGYLAKYDELKSWAAVARHFGKNRRSVQRTVERYHARQAVDPEIKDVADATGITDPSNIHSYWKKTEPDENGFSYSVYVQNPHTGEDQKLRDVIMQDIEAVRDTLHLPPRVGAHKGGDHLLVVDLADVHFGKLCVASETGYTYDPEVAAHRVTEGTKALLRKASAFGVDRVLFILGNDSLHIDNAQKKTTSGTPQDTAGTPFTMYGHARDAFTQSIIECAEIAPVDLLHCMSNHDWILGWSLSQTIAMRFEKWDSVNATSYNMSERHRKYYGWGNNAIQIDHGDGVKPEARASLFMKEAPNLVAPNVHRYAYVHHFHHKIRQRRGVDVFESEKDHVGFTQVNSGAARVDGDMQVEFVRSPSAPDGWHDRNGYINRQAVECFLHHVDNGQVARFTEWF